MTNTTLRSGILFEKQKMCELTTINAVYKRLKETGRLKALKGDISPEEQKVLHPANDSDVAKWVEAACEILKRNNNPKLRAQVEEIVDTIIDNQCDDGYYNSYYLGTGLEKRFTYRPAHELYCAGHWFEASVAYYEMCGDERFLSFSKRFIDCIYDIFVINHSAEFETPYHPEIELALVKFYRCSKYEKALRLSEYFLNKRGASSAIDFSDKESKLNNDPMPVGVPRQHNQSHLPVREQFEAVGHAVCALYLYSGMSDFAFETADKEIADACKKLFDNIVNKKMYITGGTGSTGYGESFTKGYDLANDEAYSETCAAIAFIFFAHRMLNIEKNSKYADAIERVLYNGMLSGVSLSGDAFFYVNPLEMNIEKFDRFSSGVKPKGKRDVIPERAKYFGCFCCPPNVARFLAKLDEYVYMKDERGYYVNLFCDSKYTDGDSIIEQETDYPNSGNVLIKCKNIKKLFIRIPFWVNDFTIDCEYKTENGYAVIENRECVNICFNMTPKFYRANVKVRDNCGKVALMRGPVVYCVEGVDNGDIYSLRVDENTAFRVAYNKDFYLSEIICQGYRRGGSESLYETVKSDETETEIKFIPYCVFANRGESDMLVWIDK